MEVSGVSSRFPRFVKDNYLFAIYSAIGYIREERDMSKFDKLIGPLLLLCYSGLLWMFSFCGGYIRAYWGWL